METAGLTLAELDVETADFLPAREVMTGIYGSRESNTAVIGSGNGNQSANGLLAVNLGLLNGSFNGNGSGVTQFA